MMNRGLSKVGLRLLDSLTDAAPSVVPRLFHRAFFGFAGSRSYYEIQLRRYRTKLAAIKDYSKILVVPDLNIGDSLVLQPAIKQMQKLFPQASIHYLCNKTGGELLSAMPRVTVHAILKGNGGMPTDEDLANVEALLQREHFTVTFTLCPFLPRRSLRAGGVVINIFIPFGFYVVRAWALGRITHVSEFLREFLEMFFSPGPLAEPPAYRTRSRDDSHQPGRPNVLELPVINSPLRNDEGNVVYLHDSSVRIASDFLTSFELQNADGLVFLNPDATSKYGQIPFEIQAELVERIARMPEVTAVLIGAGYASRGIEHSLIERLPEHLQKKMIIVPFMPIEAYAAVIDACDVFISSDGGPLHLSATRKLTESGAPMRNRTHIITVHGATDSRMFGYDSRFADHMPANQDAPSVVFSAKAPCRNITCINKWGKSCKDVRCFDGLEAGDIAGYLQTYLRQAVGERSLV